MSDKNRVEPSGLRQVVTHLPWSTMALLWKFAVGPSSQIVHGSIGLFDNVARIVVASRKVVGTKNETKSAGRPGLKRNPQRRVSVRHYWRDFAKVVRMVSNQEGTRDAVNALPQILLYLAGSAPHNEGVVCS